MHQHYTLAEDIRNTAAAGSQREAGMTQAFQETLAAVQQQHTAAQEAPTAAHTNAATAFEEIGASLEKAVKERKPGEVELRKLIKAPEAFSPGTWQEEKSGWTEFRNRIRIWLGAIDEKMVRIMDLVERDLKDERTPLSCCKACSNVAEENGMEANRMLMKEYQPKNRARSLELFHNILNLQVCAE